MIQNNKISNLSILAELAYANFSGTQLNNIQQFLNIAKAALREDPRAKACF
jgi:hypothetical protein